MDTTSIVRRLRDGAPCLDAKNNGACHSREPLAGCDCTIAANKIESGAKVIAALREALEFYADPAAWKSQHDPDNDVRVPDFYSETCFGDMAVAALKLVDEQDAGK